MAAAAQNALPGDALYPIKRGIENAQTDLAAAQRREGPAPARPGRRPARTRSAGSRSPRDATGAGGPGHARRLRRPGQRGLRPAARAPTEDQPTRPPSTRSATFTVGVHGRPRRRSPSTRRPTCRAAFAAGRRRAAAHRRAGRAGVPDLLGRAGRPCRLAAGHSAPPPSASGRSRRCPRRSINNDHPAVGGIKDPAGQRKGSGTERLRQHRRRHRRRRAARPGSPAAATTTAACCRTSAAPPGGLTGSTDTSTGGGGILGDVTGPVKDQVKKVKDAAPAPLDDALDQLLP